MKNRIYIVLIFLVLLSISAVSASDDTTSDIISADDNPELILDDIQEDVANTNNNDELILEENDIVPISNNQAKPDLEETNDDIMSNSHTVESPSFDDIQNAVNSASEGDTIYLKNQTYYSSGSHIIIDKSLTFIGNNTIMDAQKLSGIFNITENAYNVTIKNIIFTNVLPERYSTIYSIGSNINIINSIFTNNNNESFSAYEYNYPCIVKINNTYANVTILNTTFENNTLRRYGSALWIYANNTIIDNCIFNNITIPAAYDLRTEPSFTHIRCVSETIAISNSTFKNLWEDELYEDSMLNWEVYLISGNIKITDSNFEDNHNPYTYRSGRLIHLGSHDWTGFYKGCWINATYTIDNCNFTNNDLGNTTSFITDIIHIDKHWNTTNLTLNLLNSRFKDVNGLIYGEANYTNIINCSFENVSCSSIVNEIYCQKNVLSNCNFTNVADTCFKLGRQFESIEVSNCNFENISGSVFEISTWGGNDPDDLKIINSNFKNIQGNSLHFEGVIKNSIISHCSFINSSGENGGAIYLGPINGESVSITDCTFKNNTALLGGAIYITNQTNTIIANCRFDGNKAEGSSSGNNGGAVYIKNTISENTTITNCNFTSNAATQGGAIYSTANNTIITYCNFEKNKAEVSGAMFLENKNGTLSNCNFLNNTASKNGAMIVGGEDWIIINCSFINNTAYGQRGSEKAVGGAVGKNIHVVNCSFVNNSAYSNPNVTGQDIEGTFYFACENGILANCTFLNNSINVNENSTAEDGYGAALTIGEGSDSIIENCSFKNNFIKGKYFQPLWGGAIFIGNSPESKDLTIKNCSFINNHAENDLGDSYGGAIFSIRQDITFLDCIFINNSAIGNNSCGGAISFMWRANDSAIINCIFENNSATGGYDNSLMDDFVGGGALYFGAYGENYNFTIANSTFKNNKVGCQYLNITDENGILTVSLQGYENYMNAIYASGEYIDGMTINFHNVSYWDGEMLNSDDVTPIVGCAARNQEITIEIYDGRGTLLKNVTKITDSNGQITYDYSDFEDGYYRCVAYHPDNSYYAYIENECELKLRTAFINLYEKISQATDSITLDMSYVYDPNTDSIFENGIVIDKDLTIYGEGYFIDGNDMARIFNITNGAHVTIINLTLQNGKSNGGGAIWNEATLSVINSTFKDNDGYNGGALYNKINCYAEIDNCNFTNNNGSAGGAISNVGTMLVNNTIFDKNNATNKGGAISNYRGTLTVLNSNLTNNYASMGGAIRSESGSTVVENTYICNNTANNGGGIYSTDALTVTNSILERNSAENGSALWADNGENVILKNVKFIDCGENAIFSNNSEVDTSQSKFLITPVFEIADIADFVSGSSILVQVTETIIGESFNGIVTLSIGDINYTMEITNGTGSITVTPNLPSGIFAVKLSFSETDVYYSANAQSNEFTVNPMPTAITASAVTAVYNGGKYIVATLKDSTKKAISGVKVTIKLSNGKTYTKTTDKNGQVKLSINGLAPKTYTATITFAGNSYCTKSSKAVKVVIKKATPKLTAKAKTFKLKVKTKKYTVTLKTNQNKVMKNTKVKLTVNKKTFTAKTNKKGVATFKITNLKKKGKFTAVIKYAGSKYYNKVTKKAKITVKK